MNIQQAIEPAPAMNPEARWDDCREARDFAANCWVSAMRRIQKTQKNNGARKAIGE